MGNSEHPQLVTAILYSACLSVAGAYGFSFILPLHVAALGGNEADVGHILWAGAVGTSLFVGFTGQLVGFVKTHRLAGSGALIYAAGGAAFASSNSVGSLLFLGGFLLGVGWGVFFSVSPMILSALVQNASRRSTYFSFLSAFNALGMGLSPVLGRQLLDAGVTHSSLFVVVAMLGILGAAQFFLLGRWLPPHAAEAPRLASVGEELAALKKVARTEAFFPIVMVFLGACVFSSMMNFQTTFAGSLGLDFSVFFIAYTATVVASRFLLSGFVGRLDPFVATVVLLAIMCTSLASFFIIGSSPLAYGFSAALLGLSYGLVYPLIQAQAVNLSDPAMGSRVLAYFSLAYFLGVFGFPMVAGHIIVAMGYSGLLIALFSLAAIETSIALWRLLARRRVPGCVLETVGRE